MPNGNARLLHLLLRQTRRETNLQGRPWAKDLILGARGIGQDGFVAGDEHALDQTLGRWVRPGTNNR
jgi:hypothetical protein